MFSEFELEWDKWVGRGPGGYSLQSPIYVSPSYRYFPPYSRLQRHYLATRRGKRKSRYPTRRMVERDLSMIPSRLRNHFRYRRIKFGPACKVNTLLINELLELAVDEIRDGLPPFDLASFKLLVTSYNVKKLESIILKFLVSTHRRPSLSEIEEFGVRGRRLVEPLAVNYLANSMRKHVNHQLSPM